jgi:hypothetical protein
VGFLGRARPSGLQVRAWHDLLGFPRHVSHVIGHRSLVHPAGCIHYKSFRQVVSAQEHIVSRSLQRVAGTCCLVIHTLSALIADAEVV